MGVAWRCSASTKTAGVHGAAVEVLTVSMMGAADPACSEQNEIVGKLDLGYMSIAGQEKRRKGERDAGKNVPKPPGTSPSPPSPGQLDAR